MKDIMSIREILAFLRHQAELRAPENDEAGVLLYAVEEIEKEMNDIAETDIDKSKMTELNEKMKQAQARYVEAAKKDDPRGAICGWCNKPNDFADDCGWFMCNPLAHKRFEAGERWEFGKEPNDWRYTCEACYRGGIGAKHTAYYGESDR